VHPLDPYLRTLKTNGKLILVGIPEQPLQLSANSVVFGGLSAIFTLHAVE
jgi:D-arabinose 1-dehydrogenase-like Zn-dependent alcohol dehydrogenase